MWPQEQVCDGAEPRRQQRSDLNGPVDNNNVPETKKAASFPSFVAVPGPCEPEDLIDGIIFAANYLGSTQLLSERNPSKNIRMMQAQEAVSRVKHSEGDAQTLTEVDLFISTQRIKVLNADTQETMMDHALRTISYIADIGNIVVLMARRRMPRAASQDCIETTPGAPEGKKQYKMICHVFESEDAQLIAQSIGQAFSVAYQEFLRANGINPEDLSQKDYSDIISSQEMYNDDLIHFSNSDNCKEVSPGGRHRARHAPACLWLLPLWRQALGCEEAPGDEALTTARLSDLEKAPFPLGCPLPAPGVGSDQE